MWKENFVLKYYLLNQTMLLRHSRIMHIKTYIYLSESYRTVEEEISKSNKKKYFNLLDLRVNITIRIRCK